MSLIKGSASFLRFQITEPMPADWRDLLVLPQERGAALHPPQWATIDALAKAKGLYVLSADKGVGELRIEPACG